MEMNLCSWTTDGFDSLPLTEPINASTSTDQGGIRVMWAARGGGESNTWGLIISNGDLEESPLKGDVSHCQLCDNTAAYSFSHRGFTDVIKAISVYEIQYCTQTAVTHSGEEIKTHFV